jgi:exonuclease SbcC
MKLHKIEIENLNSLHGSHEIDFDGELANAPLFLIMGQTGAGKTTILDAICLTLFGTTPRVRDEGGRSSVSQPGERMMSKGTAHCRAMLEFSLLDDQGTRQRYRAQWRCERTHGSPTGRVKNPERSLLKRQNGSWDVDPQGSGSRLKDYEGAFNEALNHMTEDSFLRSVMLAQGQFSAFLKADEKEKAAILERLTHTNQYKRIGERAGVVKRAKEKRVEKIDDLLDELPEVDAGSLEELEEALAAVKKEEASKKEAREQVRGHVEWLHAQAKLEAELVEAKEAKTQAKEKHDDHQEDFDRLALARRARPAETLLTEVDRIKADQAEVREKKPDLLEAIEAADKALEESEAAKKQALEKLGEARKAHEERLPEIKEASKLRVEKASADEELKNARAAEEALVETVVETLGMDAAGSVDLDTARAKLDEKERAIGSLKARAIEARDELGELLGDAEDVASRRRQLREGLEGLQTREKLLDAALRVTGERAEVVSELEKARVAAEQLADRIETLEEKEASAEELAQAHQETADTLEQALDDKREALALNSNRQALSEGDPCPLCGSEDHPYLAQGTHDEMDAKFAEEKQVYEQKLEVAKTKLKEAKKAAAEIVTKLAVATDKHKTSVATKNTLEATSKQLVEQLDQALEKAGVEIQRGQDAPEVIEATLDGVQEEQAKLKEAAEQLDEADEAAREAKEALEQARLSVEQMQRDLEKLEAARQTTADRKEKVAAIDAKIEDTLDGKDPEEVEAKLKQAIEAADEAHKEAHSAQTDASEAAKLAAEKLEAAKERLSTLAEKLEEQTKALAEKLAEQEFDDVDELRAALLPDDEFTALREKTEAVKQALVRAKDRLDDTTTRLEAHREDLPETLDPTEADLEALESRVEELDEAYKEVNQRFGQLEEKLSSRQDELARRRELIDERAQYEQDLKVWRRIYSMIGVNNGGAFQKYAQALNLRELIHRANEHLQKLEPRYSLDVADEDGTPQLDFTVRDGHHAGTSRPLSTLSGGETFLVSLAMALALADYRRLDLRMETLLLDEGFGTLDQETLAKALSLLNNLHLDGDRQVGLISHVEGLKERIPYRIEVHKLGDGRSSIKVVGGGEIFSEEQAS